MGSRRRGRMDGMRRRADLYVPRGDAGVACIARLVAAAAVRVALVLVVLLRACVGRGAVGVRVRGRPDALRMLARSTADRITYVGHCCNMVGRRGGCGRVRVRLFPRRAPDTLVAHPADHEAGRHRGGGLDRETSPDRGASASEQGGERARYRYERERLERTTLRTLSAREGCALGAFPQMGAELGLFLA